MFKKNVFFILFTVITFGCYDLVCAQNLNPQPTPYSTKPVSTPKPAPNLLSAQKLKIPAAKMTGLRMEIMTDTKIIFSKHDQSEAGKNNRRFYYYVEGKDKLIDTGIDGMPGTLIAPKDGKYIVFLYDENNSNIDINNDKHYWTVLRMFHFDSGQSINLGIPARSAAPKEINQLSSNLYQYEYFLNGNVLTFSDAENQSNNVSMDFAPWNVINLTAILYAIEGTPTFTPKATSTPTFTPSPTSTPAKTQPTTKPQPTFTPTHVPTISPGIRARSDINQDGVIDEQDLLIFQLDWRAERMLKE